MKKLFLLIGAGLALSACSHTPTAADIDKQTTATEAAREANDVSTQEQEETVSIEIKNFSFLPKTLIVKPGTVIEITNHDIAGHTVTSDDGSSFNTPIVGKDQTVELTAPTTPGIYEFHCTPHPNMTGTLVVEAE